MAIRINGEDVITDARAFANISGADAVSGRAINNSLKTQQNVLKIFDSAGNEVRVLYCAAETPI
jgi:hypothetical protein